MEQTKSLQKRGKKLAIVIRYNIFYHKCLVVVINIISNSSSTNPNKVKKKLPGHKLMYKMCTTQAY